MLFVKCDDLNYNTQRVSMLGLNPNMETLCNTAGLWKKKTASIHVFVQKV